MYYQKGSKPIPSLREELVTALKEASVVAPPLTTLHREELRHLYKTQVKGTRSPSDPTAGMSSLSKPELLKRLHDHGVTIPNNDTKGSLMTALREHWVEQCNLAGPTTNACAHDTWDLVSESSTVPGPHETDAVVKDVSESLDQVVESTTALFDLLAQDSKMDGSIAHSLEKRGEFIQSIERLISMAGH